MQRTYERNDQNTGRSGGTHSRVSGRGGGNGAASGDGDGGPGGKEYFFIGSICKPTPEGYVEIRFK